MKKYSSKVDLPPGSLVYTGKMKPENGMVVFATYNETECQMPQMMLPEEAFKKIVPGNVNWIHVTGIADTALIESIGNQFSIHPLVLEDILSTNHLPKVEEVNGNLFITLKHLKFDETSNLIIPEHMSFILGPDYLLSFREKKGTLDKFITERLEKGVGRIRSRKPDYLLYLLLDHIVDQYFLLIETFEDTLSDVEAKLLKPKSRITPQIILRYKKEFMHAKKFIYPLKDEFRKITRDDGSPLIDSGTKIYLNDIYDHLLQITQTMELFRDQFIGLMDLHVSNNDYRMNLTMKRLTVVSTIFLPLTFLAGVYGMNFKYFPELEWKWGYPAFWTFNILLAVSMAIYMRRKS
jgi:magnesium transporter